MISKETFDNLKEKLSTIGGRILIVQTAFIGDVILVTSLIRTINKVFPKATAATLTQPFGVELLSPLVDDNFVFDKHASDRIKQLRKLTGEIKAQNFDVAFLPHRSLTSARIVKNVGIPVRIGFDKGSGRILNNSIVRYPKNMYEGNRNLELLSPLGISESSGLPMLKITDEDKSIVSNILYEAELKRGEYCVFAPGSVWKTKQWIPAYYRKLRKLLERHEIITVTVGGNNDRKLCESIVSKPQYNFAGKLSIMQSAGITGNAQFLISGDTAPAHLATAMGTNQVIIFGSTDKRFGFAPETETVKIAEAKLWCRPCTNHGRKKCPLWTDMRCMRDVTPELVFEYLKDWI